MDQNIKNKTVELIEQYMKKYYNDRDGTSHFLFSDGFMARSNMPHDVMISDTLTELDIDVGFRTLGIIRCGIIDGAYHIELDTILTNSSFETLIDTIVSASPADGVLVSWRGSGQAYGNKLVRRIQKAVGDNTSVYNVDW